MPAVVVTGRNLDQQIKAGNFEMVSLKGSNFYHMGMVANKPGATFALSEFQSPTADMFRQRAPQVYVRTEDGNIYLINQRGTLAQYTGTLDRPAPVEHPKRLVPQVSKSRLEIYNSRRGESKTLPWPASKSMDVKVGEPMVFEGGARTAPVTEITIVYPVAYMMPPAGRASDVMADLENLDAGKNLMAAARA